MGPSWRRTQAICYWLELGSAAWPPAASVEGGDVAVCMSVEPLSIEPECIGVVEDELIRQRGVGMGSASKSPASAPTMAGKRMLTAKMAEAAGSEK